MSQTENREKLVRIASDLFRKRGYSAVGLTEILQVAGLPKGSLYYHFPDGKHELADAATRWAGDGVRALIDRAFGMAATFEDGALALCETLARGLAGKGDVPGCPVLSILHATATEPRLRKTTQDVYRGWTECLSHHARRLGIADPEAAAFALHIRLQGAWLMAYAHQTNAPFRQLAQELRTAAPH